MDTCLVEKYSAPAPRYTSFPTAPHFHAGIGAAVYRDWLSQLPPESAVSLYLHIPFCESLCWFCGCHTRATRSYAPVASYLRTLQEEIALVGAALPQVRPLSASTGVAGRRRYLRRKTSPPSPHRSTMRSISPAERSSRWR